MPAGFEIMAPESSVAPTPTPPIEFCTGPNPGMRMPLVARAGEAGKRHSTARVPTSFLMSASGTRVLRIRDERAPRPLTGTPLRPLRVAG
jgi:hypothetical protein